MYLHAALFMLGSGFALKHDDHVRVDIFYQRMSPRARAWVNPHGHIADAVSSGRIHFPGTA